MNCALQPRVIWAPMAIRASQPARTRLRCPSRNRRASAVSEVSESGRVEQSTRVVANFNHMHALSIQYYEVVQTFRVTTSVSQVP